MQTRLYSPRPLRRRAFAVVLALPLLMCLAATLAPVLTAPCEAQTNPTKIAFLRDSNVWVMDPDGGNPQQLTVDGTSLYGCTWSPNRSQLAYVSHRGYKKGYANLYVLDVEYLPGGRIDTTSTGTVGTRLITDPANQLAPEWSPDPNDPKIAFVSGWDGHFEVSTVTVDTSGPNKGVMEHLTFNSVEGAGSNSPTWSPDGSMIAFSYGAQIRIMFADGGASVSIWQNAGGGWVYDLDWSPFIVPGSDSYIAFRGAGGNIWKVRVVPEARTGFEVGAGEVATRLTFTGSSSSPSWSPVQLDALGNPFLQIAFQTVRDHQNYRQIYVMDASGADPHSITDSPRTGDMSPAWSR